MFMDMIFSGIFVTANTEVMCLGLFLEFGSFDNLDGVTSASHKSITVMYEVVVLLLVLAVLTSLLTSDVLR